MKLTLSRKTWDREEMFPMGFLQKIVPNASDELARILLRN